MMTKASLQKRVLPVCMLLLAGLALTQLWAQTPSTIEFGCAIIAQEQIRESQALAKSIASPGDPQWRAKGDLHRKYHFCRSKCRHALPLVRPRLPGTANHSCRWS